jgi:hypothetical protein
MRFPRPRLPVLVLLSAMGCGGGGGRSVDGGLDLLVSPLDAADAPSRSEIATVDVGASRFDGGAEGESADGAAQLDPCAPAAIAVLPLAGAGTVAVPGELVGVSRLRPLTEDCTAGDTGPEVVYVLDLPAGEFHLAAATTALTGAIADTVLYVQTACGGGQELACNDDADLPSGPSAVSVAVTGPRRLFLVVDSFTANPPPGGSAFGLVVSLTAPTQAGAACRPANPGEIDPCAAGLVCPPTAGSAATCTPPTAPVIAAAELFPQLSQPATETTLFLSARDAQGDWQSLSLAFRDAGSRVLDVQVLELTDFWGQAGLSEMPFPLSVPAGTVAVDATVMDATGLSSPTVHTALTPWSTIGQSCDAALVAPDPCLGDLVCVGATCAASSAAASACAQATAIALGTPASGSAADLVSDTFAGGCMVDAGGNDRVFLAVLPSLDAGAVAWDLVATTATSTTPYDYYTQLDSDLYIRSNCADPASELACSDDVTDTDLRSLAEAKNLAPGKYYVFLDTSSPSQNGSAVAYSLLVRARAVLPSGAGCDPYGMANRCQAGDCAAATGRCP